MDEVEKVYRGVMKSVMVQMEPYWQQHILDPGSILKYWFDEENNLKFQVIPSYEIYML